MRSPEAGLGEVGKERERKRERERERARASERKEILFGAKKKEL